MLRITISQRARATASVRSLSSVAIGNTLDSDFERDFLDPPIFHKLLTKQGVKFYTGVPDSLLKNYCAYITDNVESRNHLVAANEGGAMAAAAGHYLATGCTPVVYLQNSGLGNIINPMLSLSSKHVYGLPALLLIGW